MTNTPSLLLCSKVRLSFTPVRLYKKKGYAFGRFCLCVCFCVTKKKTSFYTFQMSTHKGYILLVHPLNHMSLEMFARSISSHLEHYSIHLVLYSCNHPPSVSGIFQNITDYHAQAECTFTCTEQHQSLDICTCIHGKTLTNGKDMYKLLYR